MARSPTLDSVGKEIGLLGSTNLDAAQRRVDTAVCLNSEFCVSEFSVTAYEQYTEEQFLFKTKSKHDSERKCECTI